MTFALEWIGQRALRNPFVTPLSIPTKSNRRFKSSVVNLNKVIYGIIEDKKKQNDHPGDLLSRFMNPEEKGLKPMNDEALRDEMMTIFIAGHESSANVLSWALYAIAENQEVQQKLKVEINQIDWSKFNYANLHQLEYCTQVLNETMRLYPPLWHIGRMNLADDVIGGYHIPAGSHIRMSPLVMQRSEKYWENPNKFDPDRFTADQVKERNPFLHFPFGAGPRLCAGRNFAMMEMVVILAKIVQSHDLSFTGKAPEMSPKMTLRSKEDILISV
jgi:cytochrome P450